jgi:hypothetical protein
MADDSRERSQAQAEPELKVNDRRLFTPEGELREPSVETEAAENDANEATESAEVERTAGPKPPKPEEPQGFQREPVEEPEGIDFTMLINAMAEPALLFLGEIEHPGTGQPTIDLERARLQIDLLDLLRVKCRGNLTPTEEGLLDRILYQLRMLYVARANQPNP